MTEHNGQEGSGDSGRVRRGLGRGLGALIPAHRQTLQTQQSPEEPRSPFPIQVIALDQIRPNPFQPRQAVSEPELAELARSISEHGLLQPLIARKVEGEDGESYFELIAGERRLEAAKRAGLTEVPVVIRAANDQESLALALVENIQRSNLNPLDEANAYKRLIEEFRLTQEEIANLVGKSRSTIANSLRLLSLPEDVRDAVSTGQITSGHARAILTLADPMARRETLNEIIQKKLSVRSAEGLVQKRNYAREKLDAKASGQDEIRVVEEALRTALGTRVNLVRRGEGGQIVIYFYTEEQLRSLYDLMTFSEGKTQQ